MARFTDNQRRFQDELTAVWKKYARDVGLEPDALFDAAQDRCGRLHAGVTLVDPEPEEDEPPIN